MTEMEAPPADRSWLQVESIRASGRRATAQAHVRPKGGTDVWLTPPVILSALGPFDLDPCAAPEPRPWPTAREHYTAADDGLRLPWHGRCWVNPPYSNAEVWLTRLADHGCGTALIFARTETRAFFEQVWLRASGLLFLRGRLTFHRPDGRIGSGNSGAPSVLVAYGESDALALARAPLVGRFVWGHRPTGPGQAHNHLQPPPDDFREWVRQAKETK